ncbi:rab9 effector protein with kelch motifs-like [Gigantopelta aegis]|uniref:rab9 effector protein with kelch motifs-like n=1 Tax=Gigantopelta aegis TaxID=1735272 RepID=UPI001B889C92|nr:rab9 effector protein with kelch motifs-like [Gigantopelta aegis]XP_041368726.1 rab9 effector protein with kelch motifs-like [Gigantopelta aegis]XP_041368727.1 rab9 effector protein with kelch motifs-like [Gigantopelta aegis]XP_041368728.1 rab9 effector protein with kelch motifs-like [Gigantopelta aegis]
MAAVGDKIFVHGGMAGSTFYDDLDVLDLSKNLWVNVKRKKTYPSARAGHGSLVCGTDLYIFGGMNRDGALDDTYKLDMESSSIEDFSSDVVLDQNQSSVVHASGSDNSVSVDEPAASMDQQKTLKICLIHGGMDTHGEIFDNTLVLLLEQTM